MITKYTAARDILLIDHDCLVRNTTEHNGLSVVRNGRAEQHIPTLASLDAAADLGGAILARSSVSEYNGVDWHRTILLVKGGPVAVFDEAAACEEADYTFWDVWKTLDETGPGLIDPHTYRLTWPGEPPSKLDHHFLIATTNDSQQQLSPRTSANGEAVMRLRQIANVSLRRGESYVYQNLLASVFGDLRTPELRRISDCAFVARTAGREYVFGAGDAGRAQEIGPLQIAAQGFVLTDRKAWLLNGRELTLAGRTLHRSAQPESREIALPEWKMGSLWPAATMAATQAHRAAAIEPTGAMKQAWQFRPEAAPSRDGPEFLQCSDLDGDGQDEVFYGCADTLYVLDAAGRLRWKFAAGDRVGCSTCADLDGDRRTEVILGSYDYQVYVLSDQGKLVRRWPVQTELVSGEGHGRYPQVTAIAAADINGDGKTEVLAGVRNCWIVAYDAAGRELWKDHRQYHGVRRILVADLNANGKPEVCSANRYGGVRIYDGQGKAVFSTSSELGDVSLALGNTVAGQTPAVVNGSSTGVLAARRFGQRQDDFQFNNHGFGANEVACADLDGDGLDEVLLASETGCVYCLDGSGLQRWRAPLGSVVRDLDVADFNRDGRPEVLCGTHEGRVCVVSHSGSLLAAALCKSSVAAVSACRQIGPALAVSAFQDGVVHAYLVTP